MNSATIARELTALGAGACAPAPERRISGGSISDSYAWRCGAGLAFVKVAPRTLASMFEAEAAGLEALADAHALRVPRVLARGQTDEAAFLALEWIEAAATDACCEERLGEGLAALHAVTTERFGFAADNFIGRTPQANGWCAGWTQFFCEHRLRPQLRLAAQRGFGGQLEEAGERLLAAVPKLLSGHCPSASLLHGDLWGGNWFAGASGEPVIFDPAVYYGDREADVAMTRLFDGFGTDFYRAYRDAAPLPAGSEVRAELYNLYHVLNHANTFGAGYARQARSMIDRLLAEAGG